MDDRVECERVCSFKLFILSTLCNKLRQVTEEPRKSRCNLAGYATLREETQRQTEDHS